MFEKYCKPQFWSICVIILLKVIGTAGELLIPMGFVHMVEEIVPKNSVSALIQWGFLMVGVALSAGLLSLWVSHKSVKFGVTVAQQVRQDLFEKTTKLDCEKMDAFGISSLTSRLTMDVSLLQNFIQKLMTKGVRMLIIFVGSLASVTVIDPKLAFILFCTIPFIGITVFFTTKISFVRFKETKKTNDMLTKVIRDNVMGIRVIKALSKSEYETSHFEAVNRDLEHKSIHAGKVNVVGSPFMNLIVNFAMVATLLMGAYWVKQGSSHPASIIAFMSYSTMILTSLVSIGQFFTSFSRAAAAASRVNEVLNSTSRTYEALEKTPSSNSYIEFQNVCFSYEKSGGKPTLNNISFTIKEGEMLGIIGMTASGKSTVIQLLLRLYEVDSGEIFVKGIPISHYSSEELYQLFGVVLQGDVIFADSVANNISFGRGVPQKQIEFSAKIAQAEPFVAKLSKNYDSLVNVRGQNISGGEKQRLLISRALANQPEILILDDSTSALDYKTDANLRKSLEKDFTNCTKIIISQRVSSIMQAQKILVLEEGEILDMGSHEQLIENCENYRKIAHLQLGDGSLYA
ncbi:MAG: ABC transporter ATP-binding protein [Eubacteriales bacterium]